MTKWTEEKCYEEALKFNNRTDFKNKYSGAYKYAKRYNILDEICSHMKKSFNDSFRCIYAYEFEQKFVYVGLTNNLNTRKINHKYDENSSVFKHSKKYKTIPKLIQLTDYLNIEDAKEKEEDYVNYYSENKWTILNKVKTGSLGGNLLFWTKEKCYEEALKYNTKKELKINNISAYNSIYKHKWYDLFNHMISLKKANGYWTKKKCHEEALKYKNRSNFKNTSPHVYEISRKNKWLNETCSHMISNTKPKNYWTKEKCHEQALKFNTKKEFIINCNSAYNVSRKNNWLNDICSHMVSNTKPKNYWTKKKCHIQALKYKNRTDFKKHNRVSYEKALKNKWLNKICSHMI